MAEKIKKKLSKEQKATVIKRIEVLERRATNLVQQEQTGLERGERSLVGNVFERGGATSRAAIQSDPSLAVFGPFAGLFGSAGAGLKGEETKEATRQGALYPEEVPRFQDLAIDAVQEPVSQALAGMLPQEGFLSPQSPSGQALSTGVLFGAGMAPSAAGLAADIGTNPADVLLMLAGKTPIGGGETLGGKVAGSKVGQAVGRFATKQRHTPVQVVKDAAQRFKIDFVNAKILPQVEQLFDDAVNKFTAPIQRFGKRRAGMNDEMINHINKKTPIQVRAGRIAGKDSLDDVVVGLDKGFANKNAQLKTAYNEAFAGVADDTLIPIDDAFNQMESVLTKHGFLKNGKITARAGDPEQSAGLKRLFSEWKFMKQKSQGVIVNPKTGQPFIQQTQGTSGVTPVEWNNFKNAMSDMSIADKNITRDIVGISDALHNQASRSGLKGIDKARDLSREFFKHIELSKGFNSESKLSGLFREGTKRRELQVLDDYLGTNYGETTKDILSGRALEKIDALGQVTAENPSSVLKQQLNKAANPRETGFVKEKFFEDVFGKDNPIINRVFREMKINRRNTLIKNTAAVSAGVVATGAVAGGVLKLLGIGGGDFDKGGGSGKVE